VHALYEPSLLTLVATYSTPLIPTLTKPPLKRKKGETTKIHSKKSIHRKSNTKPMELTPYSITNAYTTEE
jgi:hypothetical protein